MISVSSFIDKNNVSYQDDETIGINLYELVDKDCLLIDGRHINEFYQVSNYTTEGEDPQPTVISYLKKIIINNNSPTIIDGVQQFSLHGQNIPISNNLTSSIYSFIVDNYLDKTNTNGSIIPINNLNSTPIYTYILDNYLTSEQVKEQIKQTSISLSNINNGTIELQGDVSGKVNLDGNDNIIINTSLLGTAKLEINGQKIPITTTDPTSIYTFLTTNYLTSEQVEEQIKQTPISLSNINNGTIELQGDVSGEVILDGSNDIIINTSLLGTAKLEINGQKIPITTTDPTSIYTFLTTNYLTSEQVKEQIKQTSISLSNINNGTIELQGDVSGEVTLDGSNDIVINTSLLGIAKLEINGQKIPITNTDPTSIYDYINNQINNLNGQNIHIQSNNQTSIYEYINSKIIDEDALISKVIFQTLYKLTQINAINPIGSFILYGSNNIPFGYLLCDGSFISKTTYSLLYAVISGIYEQTEDQFRLPDLRGKVFQGTDGNIQYIDAGLPNISGFLRANGNKEVLSTNCGGAFTAINRSETYGGGNNDWAQLSFLASRGQVKNDIILDQNDESIIYGKSDTVQPPAFALKVYIKYC